MKVLVIRFSSIGDILVTTPVVRCLKQQLNAEIHFLCRQNFGFVLADNPNIDKMLFKQSSLRENLSLIKSGSYDLIIDLQKSVHSRLLCYLSGVKYLNYNKLNFEKWIFVHFKKDRLPNEHLVDRYFRALNKIGVKNDENGLDFFINPEKIEHLPSKYKVVVLGAAHKTKRIPLEKSIEIINKSRDEVVLVGGRDVFEEGEEIANCYSEKCHNFCGKTTFNQTAVIISNAEEIYTGDTGVMHLAAALKKRIIVMWGNTTPKFGMYPYYGKNYPIEYQSKEVNLSCRPCSKLGFEKCPKDHFDCMMKQEV